MQATVIETQDLRVQLIGFERCEDAMRSWMFFAVSESCHVPIRCMSNLLFLQSPSLLVRAGVPGACEL